jgi:hypothetical protein
MEGQVYWVLFFITDNQESFGRPGVLGFIFHNGPPRNPWKARLLGFIFHNRPPRLHTYMEGQITTQSCVVGFIFYNGPPRNPFMGVQVYVYKGRRILLSLLGTFH